MPTATPRVDNVVDGQIQKWSIEAKDNIGSVFAYKTWSPSSASLGIDSDAEERGFLSENPFELLSGRWNVSFSSGRARGEKIGSIEVKANSREIKFDNRLHNQLDELIGEYYSPEERDQKAGDSTYDPDHAIPLLSPGRIVFSRNIEEPEPEPEPSPGVPEGEEPEDSQREINPLVIYAMVGILAYVIAR